jgi:phosphocarrier protein HPr
MISAKANIKVQTGIHARPANNLVSLIKGFKSRIAIKNGSKEANGVSIISILALGLKYGTEIEIIADGEDEVVALQSVLDFFNALTS